MRWFALCAGADTEIRFYFCGIKKKKDNYCFLDCSFAVCYFQGKFLNCLKY